MLHNPKWDNSPVALLRRAADLIEEHGSAKHVFLITESNREQAPYQGELQRLGSMCIRGALMKAAGVRDPDWSYWSREMKAADAMVDAPPPNNMSPPVWNNAPSTTQEMIVAKLREV